MAIPELPTNLVDAAGNSVRPIFAILIGADGQAATLASAATYLLLDGESATGAQVDAVDGGSYIWSASGTWNGATATLQSLGPDGATWLDVDTLTANGSAGVVIGSGASVRVAISGGPPANVYSSLT